MRLFDMVVKSWPMLDFSTSFFFVNMTARNWIKSSEERTNGGRAEQKQFSRVLFTQLARGFIGDPLYFIFTAIFNSNPGKNARVVRGDFRVAEWRKRMCSKINLRLAIGYWFMWSFSEGFCVRLVSWYVFLQNQRIF